MSLRVNLILSEELRSGRKLNIKSLIRIAGMVIPALIALLILQQALSRFMLISQLNVLESQWSAIQPKQKQAVRLAARLNANRTTKSEIDAWESAKPSWHRILAGIMETVPEAIQLTALRVTLADHPENTPPGISPPRRVYRIIASGNTRATNSMDIVQSFETRILEHPVLTPPIETADIVNFAADLRSEDLLSRVFTMECRLMPLPRKDSP